MMSVALPAAVGFGGMGHFATAVGVLLFLYFLRGRMLLEARLEFARSALAVSLETQTALLHAVTSLRQELTGMGLKTGSPAAAGRLHHEFAVMDRELKRARSRVEQAEKDATPESVAQSAEQEIKSFSVPRYIWRLASGAEELDEEFGTMSEQVDELRRLHKEVLPPLFSVDRRPEATVLHAAPDTPGGVQGRGP